MKRPRAPFVLFGLALALALSPDGGFAQELSDLSREERVRRLSALSWEVTATRVESELEIDGRLDDAAWKDAEPITSFYQRETFEGLPATEPTHVWVLYDDTNLYLGYRCFDREPSRPRARAMFRDENIGTDDAVAVMIDAYNDRRSAVFLATNANGMMFDMLQNGEESRTRNLNWDAVWHARGAHTESGWEAEVVVPFKSLRFELPPPGEEIPFGIGFKRNLPRKNEETYWPFVSNDSTWYRPAEMGTLHGLSRIRSGRALEVRPYALAGADQSELFEGTSDRQEVGIDAKWGVTTGLTADFTVNTDFAQEEVDVQQVNLTRFSLFFPEKRQIFLESQRSFLFGVRSEADLVFTRRIGLSDRGGIVPILGGARLSGRQGATNIGVMNMQTDSLDPVGVPTENFTVARIRRDIFERSNVGALFTNRHSAAGDNRVFGADLNLFMGRAWSFESYLAYMQDTEVPDGDHSAFAKLEYRTDRFGALYRYLGIGEDFRPGVGFVRRPNSRQNRGFLRFSPRPKAARIRQLHFQGFVDYVPNQQGLVETRRYNGEFRTVLESGDSLSVWYEDAYEFLEQPFALRPDVIIAPGAYSFASTGVGFRSFGRRYLRVNATYVTGGFWDGSRDSATLGLNYRVNKHFDISGNYSVNWVDLPSGEFTTHLVSSRVQFAFRTDLILMSLFQYNHDTRLLSSNVRFNWIPKPGSDFFIVYNELDEWGEIFGIKNRSLSVKLNYLMAF